MQAEKSKSLHKDLSLARAVIDDLVRENYELKTLLSQAAADISNMRSSTSTLISTSRRGLT